MRLHACLFALLLAATGAVAAQGMNLPGLPSVAKSASSPSVTEPTLEEWIARLEAARQEHRQLIDQPEGSSPFLAQRQFASLRRMLLLTGRVDALKARSSAHAAGDAPMPVVRPLPGPPPYSALDVDALRDQFDALNVQRAALEGTLRSLDTTLDSAVKARAAAAAELRLRQEQVARPRPGADAAEARAQVELAALLAEVAELEVLQSDETRRRTRERLAALAGPIGQLRQEIERVHTQQRLDEADLRRVLNEIAAERRRLVDAGAKLAEHLARQESDAPGNGSVRRRENVALSDAMQALRELEGVWRSQETLWRGRHDLLVPDVDPERRRAATSELLRGLVELQDRRRRLADESHLSRTELHSQQALVADLPVADPARAGERRVQEALHTLVDVQDRLRDALDRTIVQATRARKDLGIRETPATAGEWLERGWTKAGQWMGVVWNYELFSTTQTIDIDGREVTIDRGVTVGKSVGLLLLVAAGYWAAGMLSRRLIALVSPRLHLSDQMSRVLRRWVNTILQLAVLLLVLKVARIPLTAFAFLGGALAIGIGFGAQNVIKNLISGIIILFERKIRVGDIVSVGGMTGTVVTVDLRATTVRGFDGIDAIVPNSTLLENQISNWSGGTPEVRRTVAVGIAYGSDLRKAAQLIVECAKAHPLVLPVPAPEVLFSDFGNDNLMFNLQYWTRLGGARGGPGVDSDLRFAVADALQVAGISIAFPQRDVHLDVPGALRVEIAAAAAAPPARAPE